MRRKYDIFERFPDGSSLWRACIQGQFDAQRKIQELAEHSKNEFFAIDLRTNERLTFSCAINCKKTYSRFSVPVGINFRLGPIRIERLRP